MLSIAKKFQRTIFFVIKTYIKIILIGIMYYVWQTDYASSTYEKDGNLLMLMFYCLILFLLFNIYGVGNIGKSSLADSIFSYALAICITNFFAYIQFCLIARRMLFFIPIISLSIKQLIVSVFACTLLFFLYTKLNPPKSIIAVCSDKSETNMILLKILNEHRHINLENTISETTDENILFQNIKNHDGVFLINVKEPIRGKIIEYCYSNSISLYITPTVSDLLIKTGSNTQISDTPVLFCSGKNDRTEFFIIKRIMDIVISIFALIIFSPIMILISLSIKLFDGGNVLFNQQRITQNGDKFKIYKFRTMKEGSEKITNHSAYKGDERITPIGAIIRKTRMDELPQFINILKGEMSIVGPRPESINNEEDYIKIIPHFSLRHKMKAGLTGYAQIYGKYNTTPEDKLILDLLYIQNASIFLDIKLMLSTIKIIFSSDSTEGFSNNSENITLPKEINYHPR